MLVPQLIAIVGGSGAGKTWLATRLQRAFGKEASILSLDNFYRDRSHLSPSRRKRINFDNPKAIDWDCLKNVLSQCGRRRVRLPQYDFTTHTRQKTQINLPKKRIVIVEGLWLLRPRWLANLFTLRVYIECSESVRRTRRLQRDAKKRGRTTDSISNQFDRCVSPMHKRYVEPQKKRADIVLPSPVNQRNVQQLVTAIKDRLQPSYAKRTNPTH